MRLFFSFLIVAFGQPAWIAFLCPLAALLGYTLFWKEVCPREDTRWKFWVATAWYAFVESVHLSWMTAIEYQGLYILFVYLFFILCQGVQFAVLTLLIPRDFKKITFISILGLSSLWTLFEWGRSHILCGYSLNPVGLSLTSTIASMQFAALFGILGLSFWVIFVNLCGLKFRLCSLILGALPYLFGWGHLTYHQIQQERAAQSSLEVALISTDLLPSEKMPIAGYLHHYISPFEQWKNIIHALKGTAVKKLDMILFPEAAVPLMADEEMYPIEYVINVFKEELGAGSCTAPAETCRVSNLFWGQTVANFFDAEVMIGLEARDRELKKNYQSAFHLIPNCLMHNRYEKQILVPLAEYIPWEFLRPLTAKYGISQFYTHGNQNKIFGLRVPMAPSICYEETFSRILRLARLKGAELFVNLSNDNWYPYSRLAKQHFDHGRLRSVENGVPLLRSCNMGYTVALDSLGRIVNPKKNFHDSKVTVSIVQLSTYTYKTLYSFWGDNALVIINFFFLGIFCLNYMDPKKLAQNR
jgi:apolipoprotein N-acyltransferase